MKDNTPIDALLESARPTVSEADRVHVWSRISQALPSTQPVVSPYQFSWLPLSHFVRVTMVLVVVIGVGSVGAYAAAQSAKPGDFLFPIERALEDLRLSLASDTDGEILRAEFARERLIEIKALIDDELTRFGNDSTTTASTSTSTSTALPRVVVSGTTQAKIDAGIDELLLLVGGLRGNENRDRIVTELKNTVDDITIRNNDDDEYRLRLRDDGTRIEIRADDDDQRIEIKDDDHRIRIRNKDGEVSIDVNDDDDEYPDQDQYQDYEAIGDAEDRDEVRDSNSGSNSIDKAEVDVFTDITVVTVELERGSDFSFTTTATTRSAVVEEIARRTGVSEAEVDTVVDFNQESHVSRGGEDEDVGHDDENRGTDDNDDGAEDGDHQLSDDDTPIKKIDVKVERTVAEVETEYRDGTKNRFLLTYTTRATLVAEVALRLGITNAVVESLLNLEIDND